MLRKKLTPSMFRRCAIFLLAGGAWVLNGARAQGGLALQRSSDDQGAVFLGTTVPSPQQHPAVAGMPQTTTPSITGATSARSITDSATPGGPDLTGERWFQGLQEGVDQAFVSQDDLSARATFPQKDGLISTDPNVKANAIPSLPSFWSGLTCCIALMVMGMFPRVRRALR